MPGAPGSSLACKECRRRRKKCDLQQPHCFRCQKSNILCSGPENHRTFVHAYVDGTKLRKQRQTLVDNIRNGQSSSTNTNELLRAVRRQNDMFFQSLAENSCRSLLASNFSLRNVSFEPLFVAVLDEFKEGKKVGIFSGDRVPLTSIQEPRIYSSIAVSIRALLKLDSSTSYTCNVGVFALLVLYLGRLKGDKALLELSRRAYGFTLSGVRTRISQLPAVEDSSSHRWKRLACQVMTLRLYELLDHVEPEHPNALAHEDALISIMRTAGPEAFANQDIDQLLQGLRGFAINRAMIAKRPTIFAASRWSELSANQSIWSPKQGLLDIVSRMPDIIVQADQLRQEPSPGTDVQNDCHRKVHLVLDQIAELQARFEAWLLRLESLYDGPLFWHSSKPTYTGASHHDSECQPSISLQQQLRFHSGPVAGILVGYWSFRLKLWMVAADIRRGVREVPSENGAKAVHSDGMLRLQGEDWASKTAMLILEAMPYLSSCLEGNIVLQAPLKIVEEFYR